MPKITELISGLYELRQIKEGLGNLLKFTQLRSGSTERSGYLPEITQLKCGSIGKSGNVNKST